MARGGVNKSELIRKYFENNPQASVKDCISALGEGGVDVSYALVFGVRGRASSKPSQEVSVAELKMVHDFVEKSNLDPDLATRILSEFANLVRSVGTIDRFDRVLEEFGRISKISSLPEETSCSAVVESSEVYPGVEVRRETASVEGGFYSDVNDEEDD